MFSAVTTAPAPATLYCAIGDYNHIAIGQASWVETASFAAICGGASSNPGLRVGVDPNVATGALTCSGSYASKPNQWVLLALAYSAI